MSEKRCISIIGLSPLKSWGMRALLRESWREKVESFSTFKEFFPYAEKMHAFIVSADVYACNIDFFLPKRQKTLMVSKTADYKGEVAGLNIVSDHWDLPEIKEKVDQFLSGIDYIPESKGELSSRETEVLRLIASGKINKEIADALCISVNTVITHRKNLSSKLGIKSASGLSLYAMMNGII
ncbi:MAG: LuxR C-terminal-related transcriptional regulator [Muribaculaceae bacterium]|nr:LuxR C-terminal-related transcriptional regulator [Muribaculaceae bacterium]MDE5714042.1 LuxR C-terminal-related transcriptional regulator [Muribaculaceae bacterium]